MCYKIHKSLSILDYFEVLMISYFSCDQYYFIKRSLWNFSDRVSSIFHDAAFGTMLSLNRVDDDDWISR